jgi:flagellar motor switch protein FliN/FliY
MSDNDVQNSTVETKEETTTDTNAAQEATADTAATDTVTTNTAEQPASAEAPAATEESTIKKEEINAESEIEATNDDQNEPLFDAHKIDLLNELYVSITIEIGRAQIKIRDLLSLTKGSIIELNKLAGEPVDVYANGKLIASGNIITANGKYCVRLISVTDKGKVGGTDSNGN